MRPSEKTQWGLYRQRDTAATADKLGQQTDRKSEPTRATVQMFPHFFRNFVRVPRICFRYTFLEPLQRTLLERFNVLEINGHQIQFNYELTFELQLS